jgi:hypothetical protein
MKRKIILTLALFFVITTFFTVFKVKQSNSIPPKSVKDVISNSQFSYYGGVGAGTTAGDSIVKIYNVGPSFPSQTSNNLFVGDTLNIGMGGSQSIYIVRDVGNTGTVMLNTGISAVAIVSGGAIIATRSAVHTVSFEPQVNATGGIWQFLIKATSTVGESMNDKVPDQNGFDSGALTAGAVTCPWSGTATVGTTMAISLGSPAVTSYYHVVQCALPGSGTNPAGTGATGTIVVGSGTNLLINPSPNHAPSAEGTANTFTFLVRHLDAGSNLLDQTVGKIAVVESVRITATVDPSITFTIDSVGVSSVGSSMCGTGTSLSSGAASTTGDMVVFGSLGIGVSNVLAQRLSCVTNGVGGYVVTAYEDAAMRSIGTTSATNVAITIPDTTCNGGANCTASGTGSTWVTISSTQSEFGYTALSTGYAVGSSITFTNPNYYRPFGIGNANAQEIMKKISVPSATEYATVCYKITATTYQPASDYESKVTYTATATF